MKLEPGVLINGRYLLVDQLATGGMGSVWLAQDTSLDTPCALKFVDDTLLTSKEIRARFLREARSAAQIRSAHVVQVFEYGEWSNRPFIAMEYLDGEDLADCLERCGSLDAETTCRIVAHVARALSRAHAVGIIHRDLKPENVFLVEGDAGVDAKVLDFGIAKKPAHSSAGEDTRTTQCLGTPYYMSPEQARNDPIDHRSDLWALGVIAFYCLTGRPPFSGEALGSVFGQIMYEPIRPISEVAPHLPPELDEWWTKATQRDREQRFQSAAGLSDALAAALGVERIAVGAQLGTSSPPAARVSMDSSTSLSPPPVKLSPSPLRLSPPPPAPTTPETAKQESSPIIIVEAPPAEKSEAPAAAKVEAQTTAKTETPAPARVETQPAEPEDAPGADPLGTLSAEKTDAPATAEVDAKPTEETEPVAAAEAEAPAADQTATPTEEKTEASVAPDAEAKPPKQAEVIATAQADREPAEPAEARAAAEAEQQDAAATADAKPVAEHEAPAADQTDQPAAPEPQPPAAAKEESRRTAMAEPLPAAGAAALPIPRLPALRVAKPQPHPTSKLSPPRAARQWTRQTPSSRGSVAPVSRSPWGDTWPSLRRLRKRRWLGVGAAALLLTVAIGLGASWQPSPAGVPSGQILALPPEATENTEPLPPAARQPAESAPLVADISAEELFDAGDSKARNGKRKRRVKQWRRPARKLHQAKPPAKPAIPSRPAKPAANRNEVDFGI